MTRGDIGKFRHRIKIYTPTRVDDGGGGFSRSDPSAGTLLDTVWADIRTIKGREIYRAMQLSETITHDIMIRYQSALANIDGHIIVFDAGSQTFYVETCMNKDHRKQFIHLMCREGGAPE